MSQKNSIETARLILRPWQESDLAPFAKLNADPWVMEFFTNVKTLEASTKEYLILKEGCEKYGWGFWAVVLKESDQFIGTIGIKHIPFEAHFTPAVEIGWRIDRDFWGNGYATEGALASLKFGFENLNLDEIVAITVPANIRSQNVMKKIGMKNDPIDNFDHPMLPEGHKYRRHVLYRIKKQDWPQN